MGNHQASGLIRPEGACIGRWLNLYVSGNDQTHQKILHWTLELFRDNGVGTLSNQGANLFLAIIRKGTVMWNRVG